MRKSNSKEPTFGPKCSTLSPEPNGPKRAQLKSPECRSCLKDIRPTSGLTMGNSARSDADYGPHGTW